MPDLDLDYLRSQLRYEPETGDFWWLIPSGRRRLDIPAGHLAAHGYVCIGIKGKLHYGHRLAWFYVHGIWPPETIDHINGNPADNRLCNLRLASQSQNNGNTRGHVDRNTTGFKGVSFEKYTSSYKASIRNMGRQFTIGRFSTAESAARAYDAKATELFGEFARVNFQ